MPNLSVMTNKEIKKYQLGGYSFKEFKHLRKKLSVIIKKEIQEDLDDSLDNTYHRKA